MRRIVLTGPPGAGKTTTFQELQKKLPECGFFNEISREIIQFSLSNNLDVLPWSNPEAFNMRVLNDRIRDYQSAKNNYRFNFYDRGLLDSLSYAKYDNTITSYISKVSSSLRYDLALFFPFEESIYINDTERQETAEQARVLEQQLYETYQNSNIKLEVIEFDTIENRVNRILEIIKQRNIY